MKNKFLTGLVCLICFVFISGCGQKDTGKVTVTWAVGKDVTGVQKQLIEMFKQKNPDIDVKIIEMPESATTQHDVYVTYLIAGDSSIDIYSIDIIWPAEFASAGWIAPLDEYISKQERDKFLVGPVEGCTYKGKLYAIPWFTDAGLLYYRKDLLKESNLKVPETWNELVKQSKIIQEKKEIYGFVFQAQQYEGLICNFLEYVWSNEAGVLNKKNEVIINNKKSVEALQFMVDMMHKHKIVPSGITTYQEEESREVFTSGHACFHRNWPYVWAIVQDESRESKVKDKIGLAPLPHFPGCKSSACLGGWNLAISAFSKNKDTAWKFIEFMTSFEAQKIYAMKGGRLPTRKNVYADSEILKFAPHYKQLYKCFVTARPRPVSPEYSRISDILQVEIHQALTQRKTPQEALDSAKAKIGKISME